MFACSLIGAEGSTHTHPSMSTPTFDYYRILGLTKDATSEDGTRIFILFLLLVLNFELWTVRRAYKQKVLETHPDKLSPDSTEEEKDAAREQFSRVRCQNFTSLCPPEPTAFRCKRPRKSWQILSGVECDSPLFNYVFLSRPHPGIRHPLSGTSRSQYQIRLQPKIIYRFDVQVRLCLHCSHCRISTCERGEDSFHGFHCVH